MYKKILLSVLLSGLSFTLIAADYGAASVKNNKEYTLEEMLHYALEDEHLALEEYKALMDKFDLTRPYSNIIQSEETHIAYLEDLYQSHNIPIPEITAENHLVLPSSAGEAAAIAVQAEIKNIAMYEIFLKQDLPGDVRDVFLFLKKGSENHLRAFERQVGSSQEGRGKSRG